MGEELKNLFGKAKMIYFAEKGSADYKTLPIVEGSVKMDDDRPEFEPKPISLSFNMCIASDGDFVELYDRGIERAQEMLDSIKKSVRDFYVTDPPRNRKERRKRAKKIKDDIVRFRAYCKNHNIEIKTAK